MRSATGWSPTSAAANSPVTSSPDPPTWRLLLDDATVRLGGEANDARRILGQVAGWSRAELVSHLDDAVSERLFAAVESRVDRRATGEPLQYVLGSWGFRHLDLLVDRRVLIPRPETETVVDIAIAALRSLEVEGDSPVVVDLGTGSGAIALSIASEVPHAHVWATDASAEALDVARVNLIGLGQSTAGRVELREGDWFAALPEALAGMISLVVTNPPYVRDGDELPSVVADWEPNAALRAGTDGLDAIRRIVADAPHWLARPGGLVIEHAPDQGEAVAALARGAGALEVSTHPDLSGRPRCTAARW